MPESDVGSSSPSSFGAVLPIQFPPCFTGDGTSDFGQWSRRFEVAVDACPNAGSVNLAKTLGSRLTGAAFNVWYALPSDVKNDYKKAKAELGQIFSKRDEITSFQRMVNARPRQPGEPLAVYKSELDRLTRLAFPLLDDTARRDELFRRFVAGLSPDMRAKCHEHGAADIDKAMDIAQRVELASDAHGHFSPFSAPTPSTPQVAVATTPHTDPLDQVLKRLDLLQVSVQTLQSQCDTLREAQHDASRSRSRNRSDYSPSRPRDRYRSPTPYNRDNRSFPDSQHARQAYTRSPTPDRHRYYSEPPHRGRSPSPSFPRRNEHDRDAYHQQYQTRDSGYRPRNDSPGSRSDGRQDGDRFRHQAPSPFLARATRRSSPARVSFQQENRR